ncbi:MAG TPA: DUF2058 family protein [Rhodanobacteraceae bacterium]|nr:DUF2058 family protein [Rhodanobacteraceae bacterium]
MADSLREQLLKSGIVKQTRKNKPANRKGGQHKHAAARTSSAEMDLAKAYAIRAKAEAGERKRAKAEAEAEARARKERKLRLQQLLQGKALNKADAERPRHFEYGGKIRRVYVDDAQWKALNDGRLGVVQSSGSYVLVSREIIDRVQAFAPDHVALLVDSEAVEADDGVPDDLVW